MLSCCSKIAADDRHAAFCANCHDIKATEKTNKARTPAIANLSEIAITTTLITVPATNDG